MDARLAILYPAKDGGAAKLRWLEAAPPSHALPDVNGFNFIDLAVPAGAELSTAQAAATNQRRKLEGLARALHWPRQALRPDAVTESVPTANDDLQTNVYVETRLGGHEYFLHVRGSGSVKPEIPVRSIQFVTGSCLFSNRTLTVLAEDGSRLDLLHPNRHITHRIHSIEAAPQLSFYELESCARQARLIADVAKTFGPMDSYSVTIAIPREQYYCYLIDALKDRLIDTETMLHWVALVDRRYDLVAACMGEQLLDWSQRLELPMPQIALGAGFGGLRKVLVEAIKNEKLPGPAELSARLAGGSSIWERVNRDAPPRSLPELINFSYAVEYVRAHKGETSAKPLLVAVEDRSEFRILQSAQGLSRALSPGQPAAPMVGMYALEQALIGGVDNWSLYLNDPGARFEDEDRTYSSRELLGKLYGARFPDGVRFPVAA